MAGFLDPSKKVNYKKYIMKTSQIQIQDEAFRGNIWLMEFINECH